MTSIRRGKFRLPAAAFILLVAAGACRDLPTAAPPVGTIVVSVQTDGGDPDWNGYQVVVGSEKRSLGTTDTVAFPGLETGAYRVALEDVASNCTVKQGPEQSVTLHGSDVIAVQFIVSCAATGIVISTRTTGPPNTQGYVVWIDGVQQGRTNSNGSLIISRLEPGMHTIVIDPGRGCRVSGPGTLTLEVINRSLTSLSVDVTCEPAAEATIRFGNLFDCGDPLDPTRFWDGTGSSEVYVRVGGKVEWVYQSYMHPACTARIVSTLVPPGGVPIDSGILKPGESFHFTPAVPGTWQFTDLISGGSGALIVMEVP